MEKGHFLRSKDGKFAISLIDGGFLLETGEYISEKMGENYQFKHTRNIDKTIRETMVQMGKEYDKILKYNIKLKSLEKEHNDLKQAMKKIEDEARNIQKDISVQNKNISCLITEMKSLTLIVSPNEHAKMSFYDGTLDIPRAIAIVNSNVSRTYKYRFGFSYKGAKTKEISKLEAVEILRKNEHYTDFFADSDSILINQYSGNDMY